VGQVHGDKFVTGMLRDVRLCKHSEDYNRG
jgi:hypothetical protein